MTYFILLTRGNYSDYGVGGLYASDTPVSQSEFDELVTEYAVEQEKLYETMCESIGTELYDKLRSEYFEWSVLNDPEKVFVHKYDVRPVEYIELHNSN